MKKLLSLFMVLVSLLTFADTINETDRFTVSFARNSNTRFVTLPLDQIKSLCGDEDGCQIRMSMSSYQGMNSVPPASTSALFFYDIPSQKWRASEPGSAMGEFGNNSIEHVLSLFNKCYLTDGYFKDGTPSGDKSLGLSLLYFGPESYKVGCSVTLID